jgi:hypothetical protein
MIPIYKKGELIEKLGQFIGSCNMVSHKQLVRGNCFGRPVPNQTILEFERGRAFQSYDTLIAVRFDNGTVYLNEVFDHTATTRNYTTDFLEHSYKEIKKLCADKVYTLAYFTE